jgi:hypothetical protein
MDVPTHATLNQILPPEVKSVTTSTGQRVSRRDFERTPIDPNMRLNYTELEKGHDRLTLLGNDLRQLQSALTHGFESMCDGGLRIVSAHPRGEYVKVLNFPLPDGYRPDAIDLLLVTTQYPGNPPFGLHVLQRNNERLLGQLQETFGHVFPDGFSAAEEIPGYTWICYHYEKNHWRYNAHNPSKGDNITKMLVDNFYDALADSL